MIKKCKEYFNILTLYLENTPKKNKIISFIFSLVIGLLLCIPLVCIFINLFMQILGLKGLMTLSIIICGVLLHFMIALINPIYYMCLYELDIKKNFGKISYNKLFMTFITDWLMIIFIIVCVVGFVIIVNMILF